MKIIAAIATVAVAVNAQDPCDDMAKASTYSTCALGKLSLTDACVTLNGALGCAEAWGCQTSIDQAKAAVDAGGCAGCFPSSATVELANGKTKNMDQVVVGDKVRVGPKEFSEVYFFSSEMSETTSKFTKIVAEGGAELLLTGNHYLYVNGELATADTVKTGDVIVLANGTKAPVVEVTSAWSSGLYNPHTLHGDVIVDGVKTSTYTSAVHPRLAHALLAPLRTMYSAGVTFGSQFRGATKGLPSWMLKAIGA